MAIRIGSGDERGDIPSESSFSFLRDRVRSAGMIEICRGDVA